MEQTAGESGRARHHARVRAELCRAARALAEDPGFDAVSVAEIAAVAGVSRRTFFRHYPTKEAAFFGEDAGSVARWATRLSNQGPAYAVARDALIERARDRDLDGPEARVALRQALATPSLAAWAAGIDRQVEEALAEALARGADPVGALRARVLAAALAAVDRAATALWAEGVGDTCVELLCQGLDLLEDGFRHDRGTIGAGHGWEIQSR